MSKEQIESEKPHIRTFETHLDTLQSNCDEAMKLFSSFNMKSSSEILVEITCSNFKTWRKRKWQK